MFIFTPSSYSNQSHQTNQLLTFPISKKDIVKILPFSTAMQKGHMKRLPQGFQNTREKKTPEQYPLEDMTPAKQEILNVKCFVSLY